MTSSMMVYARLESFLSREFLYTRADRFESVQNSRGASYFGIIFNFIGTVRRNGSWWNTWTVCTEAGSTPWGKQCFTFMLWQQCWRTFEQVLSTDQQITCLHLLGGGGLHTTDISCAWAWIMNGCVFGWTLNNKVGSLLSLPLSDTPAASRVN